MTERPLAIRLTDDLIARLDRIAETLSKRAAGMYVSRSHAIRSAVERGADSLEIELGLVSRKRKR